MIPPREKHRNFLDQLFDESPLARIAAGGAIPDVKLPSFEGLSLDLPTPPEVTDEVLKEQLEGLLYRASPRKHRPLGDEVDVDDEINVDCCAFSQGQLLPFLTHSALTLGPGRDNLLPDLRLELAGAPVGTVDVVEMELPDDYPLEKFRDQPAFFSVRINSAAEIDLLDLDSPVFLESVGLGNSADEVVDFLARGWKEAHTHRIQTQAFSHFMVQLADRAGVEISKGLIDKEIGRAWRRTEGELLTRLQIPTEQQDHCLSGWLDWPELRAEAERRLKISVMTRAVVAQNQDFFSVSALRDFMDRLIVESGSVPAEVRADFKEQNDEQANNRMVEALLQLRAVEFVLSHVPKVMR